MKQLSKWAKVHKSPARFIIILSFFLLTSLGIITGKLLSGIGISISSNVMSFFIAVYLLGIFGYPARAMKRKKLSAASFYIRQKSCDFLLAASTFCMIVFLSNQPNKIFVFANPLSAAIPLSQEMLKDSSLKAYKTIAAFSASLKDENGKSLKWKVKKQLLKEQVRAIKKDSDMSKGGKVALIVLSVLVALGLVALVLALACDLSCSGSEGAAVLVGVGGTALVIFLLALAIRGITGKKRRQKIVKPEPDNSEKMQ